jgi:hypothetical protein
MHPDTYDGSGFLALTSATHKDFMNNDPSSLFLAPPGPDSIPFWQGCHLVEGAEDPIRVRLETHPDEGECGVCPAWAIVWDDGTDEHPTILLAADELMALARLLIRISASYEDSKGEGEGEGDV